MTQSRSKDPGPDDTTMLLTRARAGDRDALEQLFARQMPLLRRWATGRLPSYARRGVGTSDLVQDTVIATLARLDDFEPRGDGALQAYLRRAVINSIRSLLRRAHAAPEMVELDDALVGGGASPLAAAIDGEMLGRYRASLSRLTALERDAVVARVEFGLTYPQLAELLDKPSPDAARMIVTRALVRVIREMQGASAAPRHGSDPGAPS